EQNKLIASLKSLVIVLALVFLGKALLSYISERVAAVASASIRRDLRLQLVDRIFSTDAASKRGPAELSLLATRGVDNLDPYFAKFIPQLFIASVVPFIVGIAIAYKDFLSGIVIICTIALIPLFGILIGRFTASATQKKWQSLAILSGYYLDLISGIATLKLFGRSKQQAQRLQEVGDDYRSETMKVLRISFLSSLALEIIATLSVALMAVTIGLRLVNGSITLQTGLFVLVLAPEVYWPIRQVSAQFHAASDGVEAANRIFEILETPVSAASNLISDITEISWSDLSVEFEGREKLLIPAASIKAGAVNLIAGPSGSGKSTLISILLGFRSDYSGDVIVKGKNGSVKLSDLDKTNWRKQLSWLAQEPHFQNATIFEVLKQIKKDLSKNEATQLLASAGLEISDMPNGLDTRLGGLNEALSIGQRRKVALARAVIKPSSIVILDEPSASVDDASEVVISDVIKSLSKQGKIVLVVSHRENLISDVDSVIHFGALK
ncbi:MAG: thiol reductant ABC exporter subunit CydD, partial [Actinobacteria bacterium]|nr:thiol reductant ABC exporter subunit CydD [Actinomycetota bacterium]